MARWACALGVAALAACATTPPTPYIASSNYSVAMPDADGESASRGSPYGYRDADISDTLIRVTFRGNASTSPFRAMDFALLRCAEVALDRGYPYMVIRERLDATLLTSTDIPSPGSWSTSCDKNGVCTSSYNAGSTATLIYVWPNLDYVVELHAEMPENETIFALDAAFVRRSIRAKYDLGE